MTRTRITDMFPSQYIKAADVKDAGGELEVTIAGIESAELPTDGGGNQTKFVLRFRDHDRGLILNRTNADTLDELFESDTAEDWVGKTIRLHIVPVKFQGKRHDGIRIKAARQQSLPLETPSTSQETIPF